MDSHVDLKTTNCFARVVALWTSKRLPPWMGPHVAFKIVSYWGRVVTLFAIIRHFSWVSLHVATEVATIIARVVALWTIKRFLSAVNSHVSFQLRWCAEWVAALVALVSFLCLRLNLVNFGHLGKLWSVYSACAEGLNQLVKLKRKRRFLPEPCYEKWEWCNWKVIIFTE